MTGTLYWAVFISGLLSATLLPGNSEAVFSLALLDDEQSVILLLTAVTIGNTLGGMISWGMGRIIALRYPADKLAGPSRQRAMNALNRWGSPVLLLSWVPVIGDPLCLVAGWLKISAIISLIFILVGKLSRYALLAWLII